MVIIRFKFNKVIEELMQKEKIKLAGLTLVGITTRTNNKNEMDPETAKIGLLAGYYWGNQICQCF